MSCLYPKLAYLDTRVTPNKVLFKPLALWLALDRLPDGVISFSLPCGKCFGCLKSRALDITVRAVAESRVHDFSSFLTLTVSDEHMAAVFPHGLCHRPWQLFAKRLRKQIGPFTFLMCGEYGSLTMRPHYHAVIFGPRFVDGYVDDNCNWICSRVLQECWPYGQIMLSDCNSNRCAYVAGYTCKDFSLGRDKAFYERLGLGLPYVKWSRRPALGLRWFLAFRDDLLLADDGLSFVLDGKRFNFSGRYFYNKFRFTDPAVFDRLRASRLGRQSELDTTGIMRQWDDNRRACELKQYRLKKKKEVSFL